MTLAALPLLTLVAAGSSSAPLVISDSAYPGGCGGQVQRHELLLPSFSQQEIPTNASFWFQEFPDSPVDPAMVRDGLTGDAVPVDEVVHATGNGVVLELAPQTELTPNHDYEIVIPNSYGEPDVTRVRTSAERDEARPRAPTINDISSRYLRCSGSGLNVAINAEAQTITFAENADDILIGFGVYAIEIPAAVDSTVDFVAYSVDIAGNVSVDSRRLEEKVDEPDDGDGLFGCRCVRTRAGWVVGLLLVPALFVLRRRLRETPYQQE